MKADRNIIALAANVGIDARGKTVAQVREMHKEQTSGLPYADQHDARLIEALDRAEPVKS